MKATKVVIGVGLIVSALLFLDYFLPGERVGVAPSGEQESRVESIEARIRRAARRSENVKGVYMTSAVANDRGRAATARRSDILNLLHQTELNALVIDVKETEGGLIISEQLKDFIGVLHNGGIWVIARQVVFKDDSQERLHPEWYLKRSDGRIWRDYRGGSWLDQVSPEVRAYQLAVAKAASDAGFDEIQFDYIRFPSDGDTRSIVYPVYDPKRPKYEVLGEFFQFLHRELKRYRPDLILSADLFGYAALHEYDLGIGQRLADIGENFDYVSLMVYPSHYYAGFQVAPDPARNLGALYYPYRASSVENVAAARPYEVVYRSLLSARDVLEGRRSTTTASAATSSPPVASVARPERAARLRPWLQDFNLASDTARGIRYDALKVRAQIDAAEAAGSSGWLLWSPSNIYTRAALKPEGE